MSMPTMTPKKRSDSTRPQVVGDERSEVPITGGRVESDRAPTEAPDPEVRSGPKRRRFSAAYKLRIVQELDRCSEPGEIGALLRREGLYSSLLTEWRRARDQGAFDALREKRRGPKPRRVDPLEQENSRLQREVERLRRKLEQAELIIDVQKKVSALLGIPLASVDDEKPKSS